MKKHLLALFGLALFLAGCGSSGGVGTPPPSSITLTVVDPEGKFNAAAYQVGTGNWQTLNLTGTTTKTGTFDLGSQTKYGVAVRCNDLVVRVIQVTSTELKNPRIVCSSPIPSRVSFTIKVNISGITLDNGDQVCVNDSCQSAGVNNITLNLEPGIRDLLVTLRDSSGWVKVAKVEKGVNVTNGGNTTVRLESGDVNNEVPFTVPSAPSGYTSTGASVVYLSTSRTAFGLVNASPISYRPVSGFGSGDLYGASITAFNANSTATLMSIEFFNWSAPSLAFPAPWPNGSLTMTQAAHPTVTGLTRNDPDLKGYGIVLEGNNQFKYTAALSKAWLDSANSYTLPDLSSQLGYTRLQNNSFASFRVTAALSNKTVADLANLLTNPSGFASGFAAGQYLKMAEASRNFTVGGGGNLTLP